MCIAGKVRLVDAERIFQNWKIFSGYIYRRKDYDRKFSAKVGVWLVFLMLVAPSTVIPFVLWYKSKAKYDQETSSKKSK